MQLSKFRSIRRRPVLNNQNLRIEALEQRQLLAADLMINEFLARNDGGLRDGTGRASDWIEVFNSSDRVINLSGYHLTDNHDDLTKWTFPERMLEPGEYLVVFASGQETTDFVDADGNLHTNFTIRRGGEYLALVSPDNQIVTQFGSATENFPEQLANVSYGGAQGLTLVTPESASMYRVPGGDLGTSWTMPGFDAAGNGFVEGTAALGYEGKPENRTNYVGLFTTEIPASAHAVYARTEFQLGDPTAIGDLTLSMQFDNGFIAYLNGVEVARENAAENTSWFSPAPDSGPRDSVAVDFVDFDISEHVGALVSGTNVLAIHGLDNLSDNSDKLWVMALRAGARDLEAATGQPPKVGYMPNPTPLTSNGTNDQVFSGFVQDTRFSIDRGFYNEPFQVEITTASEGAEIRYTLDGSAPTATTGTVYTEPITISTTTTLRAAAFLPDFLPSNVDTQTYIFPVDVFKQDQNYDSADWGEFGPDWEMDQEVINSSDPESRPEVSDLLALPTLSLVMNWEEMFGAQGIYIRGESEERATSAEYILADGSDGFQIDGSVQIVGGSSPQRWKSQKLSMRLKFNREFGSGGDLGYPVFGPDAAQTFDTLTVDAHLNNVWHYGGGSSPDFQREIAQYLRDAYAADMQLALGGYATHDQFVYVYINGVFWGMHRLHERPDDNFAASYLGGENTDYDVLKHGPSTVVQGTRDNYASLLDAVREDMTDPAKYQAVTEMLDVPDFINYMIMNIYGGNSDWAHHNWYASFNKVDPEGRWRFHSWDAEKVIQGVNDNLSTKNDRGGPTEIHQRLSDNPDYQLLFADHIQKHLLGDGVLTPENASALYQVRLAEIDRAVRVESARWGDAEREQPYTRGVEWVAERDRLLNEYFPQRTDVVIGQFRRAGLYPDVEAPQVNQSGGVVPTGFQVDMQVGEGQIYYTTTGADPRLADGSVSPQAQEFANAIVVSDSGLAIKARTLKDGQWSALVETSFEIQSAIPLRITEINYKPHAATGNESGSAEQFEFVELTNTGTTAIDLGGVQLVDSIVRGQNQGIQFRFAAQSLAAGESVVVVRDKTAFQSRYGNAVRIASGTSGADGAEDGVYGGNLSNIGEQLSLVDASGKTIQRFTYFTGTPWPTRAAGQGSTLQIINSAGDYQNVSNWRASSQFGGSPGGADQSFEGQIAISEVLASPANGQSEMIELQNTTNSDIDVNGWYVTDTSSDYFKARISGPTIVPAGGYQVLDIGALGLDLNGARGGEVLLMAADANGKPLSFVAQIQYGNAAPGVSVGPAADPNDAFVQLDSVTLGQPNSGPKVGDVIISEVNYDPVDLDGAGGVRDRDFEYIELYNRTSQPIDIGGWQLTGDVEFTFEDGTVVGAEDTLLVTRFDPGRGTTGTVFRFAYGLQPNTPLVGGHRDALDDEAGTVQLFQAGESPANEPNFAPLYFVDQLVYQNSAPWPESAAGGGDSLHRTRPADPGQSAGSWFGAAPSPTTVEFVAPRHTGDSNGDGEFNQLDIVAVSQGGKYNTGQPATFDQGDWNGDGVFNQLDIVAALQAGTYLQGALNARIPMTEDAADVLAKPDGHNEDAVDLALADLRHVIRGI